MFELDEDYEASLPTNIPASQLHNQQDDPIWTTLGSPFEATQHYSSFATPSDAEHQAWNPSYFPHISSSLAFITDVDQSTFTMSTRDDGGALGELRTAAAHDTVSPSLLSTVSDDGGSIPTQASPSMLEPGTGKEWDFQSHSPLTESVSPVVAAAGGSYAFPPRAPDVSRKRRRRYTTSGLLTTPRRSIETTFDRIRGMTTTTSGSTNIEHPVSRLASFSLLQAVQVDFDSNAPSPYSVASTTDERVTLSPTEATLISHWKVASSHPILPPALQPHYDSFIKLLSGPEVTIEDCQRALAPFSIMIMGEIRDGSNPSSSRGQSNEVIGGGSEELGEGTEEDDSVEDSGGDSIEETRDFLKRKLRYIARQCRICHHTLFHQSQMHQHIMDHFGFYPYQCEQKGW
ncbi:hypothetical protein FRC17_009727 [Serendipita sp. 399]|nr:hypothetical protein FRC17_009727 [Serendipita sp. 399]